MEREVQKKVQPGKSTGIADPGKYLATLVALGPRPTCGLVEKRAAYFFKDTLTGLGLETSEEPFTCNPSVFRPYLLLFFAAIAMAALPEYLPYNNVGFFFAAMGCFYLRRLYTDLLNAKDIWFMRFFPKHSNRNIVGKIKPKGEVKKRIVIMGYLDSARCSPIFSEMMVKSLRFNMKLDRALLLSLAALYLIAGVTDLQFPYYLAMALSLYVLGGFLLLLYSEVFCPFSPGVNGNATGVAGVLSLAETLAANPLEETEVWCVALGAQEPGAYGSKAFWQKHAETLRQSYILNLDTIASAKPRYLINEGYLEEYGSNAEMIEILDELQKDRPDLELSPMALQGWGGYTDATPLLRNGCKAITLLSTEPDGYIKHWHTMQDTIEHINKSTYHKVLEVAHFLVRTLDEDSSVARAKKIAAAKVFAYQAEPLVPARPLGLQLLKRKPRFASQQITGYRILSQEDFLQDENLHLKDFLWKEFDQKAAHVFHTSAFLESQAKSAPVANGFIILEEKPNEPVAMVPYFVYHELIDDAAATGLLRRVAESIKKKTLRFGLPIIPGFKTIFIGTPFTQPSNCIYTREGRLEDLATNYRGIKRTYSKALRRLLLRHLAIQVSHFHFERTPQNDAFLRSLGFKPTDSWPDMVLHFNKVRYVLKDRLRNSMYHAATIASDLHEKHKELKGKEAILRCDLEFDATLDFKAKEKTLLMAAEAQNQIDHVSENLQTGRYIDALIAKNATNFRLREEAYPGYDNLAQEVRDLVAEVFDLDALLKDARKSGEAAVREHKTVEERVRNLLQKSLCNKYCAEVPKDLDVLVEFFLEKGHHLDAQEDAPSQEWKDITVRDILKRLEDLNQAWEILGQKRLVVTQAEERVGRLQELREVALSRLGGVYGHNLKSHLQNLLRAEKVRREILKLEERIAEERDFFAEHERDRRNEKRDTPERKRMRQALKEAQRRLGEAMNAFDQVETWEDFSEVNRTRLKEWAEVMVKIEKIRLDGATQELRKLQQELKEFNPNLPPTFDDYVKSLGENERNAMHRNLNHIRDTEQEYPVEIVTDRERILELALLCYHAYHAQYSSYELKWLRMTEEYFRYLADLPGTELLVCWHKSEGEKKFAGFIVHLDHQFNHRMGIMPEYKHNPEHPEDDHMIYFRLTLTSIYQNLMSRKGSMWIAQTTYEAKRRLGFVPYPVVNYRKAVFGFQFVTTFMYRKLMGRILDPQILYQY